MIAELGALPALSAGRAPETPILTRVDPSVPTTILPRTHSAKGLPIKCDHWAVRGVMTGSGPFQDRWAASQGCHGCFKIT